MQWGAILLYFYVPMFPWKDFLMGQIRKIQKHKEERDRSAKILKQEGKNGGKKRRDFDAGTFPYSCVLHQSGKPERKALGLPPSCNPPSGEPIRMGTSPTT